MNKENELLTAYYHITIYSVVLKQMTPIPHIDQRGGNAFMMFCYQLFTRSSIKTMCRAREQTMPYLKPIVLGKLNPFQTIAASHG